MKPRQLRDAPPPRGLLRPPTSEPVQHRRVEPCPALRERVAHFWWVSWTLSEPLSTETLPHPTSHVVFENPGRRAELAGPPSSRFRRTMEGSGRVFGIKFRPGMFRALITGSMARFADELVPIHQLLGKAPAACHATALSEAVHAAEPWLLARCPPVTPEELRWRDLTERVEHDRDLTRVEQLAELAGCSVRTLERRLRWHVGQGPKFVIRRYRLLEAAERLKANPKLRIVELAAALGYFDQPHFVRDFRAVIGRSPSEFASAFR